MTRIEALLDTNVLVAACAPNHQHHEASAKMFDAGVKETFAVAAHSIAEAFSTLTRGGEAGLYGWTGPEAVAALDVIRSVTLLVGLTPAQTVEAVRDYAAGVGIGPRMYDKLIGQTAIVHEVPMIVSWNIRHMRPLFPELDVRTPTEWGDKAG